MNKKPQVTCSKIIADTNVFSVERIGLRFANGTAVDYERLHSNIHGIVMIIPLLDGEALLLVREYAAGVERYELGFPKGLMEEGESVKSAANREIKEEIGHGSQRLTVLKSVSVIPGYANLGTHIVLAEDLYPAQLPGDEPDPLEAVTWWVDELASLIAREDFTEARNIAAVYLLEHYLYKAQC